MRRKLETVLEIACESSVEHLPELLGDLERARVTAMARFNSLIDWKLLKEKDDAQHTKASSRQSDHGIIAKHYLPAHRARSISQASELRRSRRGLACQ
jgi:hypothetical protein